MKNLLQLLCLTIVACCFSVTMNAQSCADGSYEFADMTAIFTSNGCTGCHGTQGGLNLTDYANVTTGGNNGAGGCGPYADPLAFLVGKVDGSLGAADGCGNPMPPGTPNGSPGIPAADIAAIQSWIDAGAPEFCPPPPPEPPFNDGVCDPATTLTDPVFPTQTTICTDASDAPTLPTLVANLPDTEYIVEVNGVIQDINPTGDLTNVTLADGDVLCYYGFTYDLAEINNILTTANQLCPLIDCDNAFGIPGLTQAIADLVNGVNDGNPGLNNLQEALDFAGSLAGTISSAQDAAVALNAVNAQIGDLLGNICYASTSAYCLTAQVCSAQVDGCTDPAACNFDPLATNDDGSCQLPDGCTDATATNFNPAALCNDNSCAYACPSCTGCDIPTEIVEAAGEGFDGGTGLSFADVPSNTYGLLATTNNDFAGLTFDIDATPYTTDEICAFVTLEVVTNADIAATPLNLEFRLENGDCGFFPCPWIDFNTTITAAGTYTLGGSLSAGTVSPNGTFDPLGANTQAALAIAWFQGAALTDDIIVTASNLYIVGCVNDDADDDGTCNADDLCPGGPEPGSACDDGDATTENDVVLADCSCEGTQIVSGCTDNLACNFAPTATSDDGSCEFPGDACDDGDATTENDVLQADCSCAGTLIPVNGCTDPTACNFDPAANTDDGSCVLPDGCTDPTATNFDSNAQCNDNSCAYACPSCVGCDIPTEITEDPGAGFDDGSGNSFGNEDNFGLLAGGNNIFAGVSNAVDVSAYATDEICIFVTLDVSSNADLTASPYPLEFRIENICGGFPCPWIDFNTTINGTGSYFLGGSLSTGNNTGFDPTQASQIVVASSNFTGTALTDDIIIEVSNLYVVGCVDDDTDGDGTCNADDLCVGPEPGAACDDGDPNTNGDVIQADCSCAGTVAQVPGCIDNTACNFDAAATQDDGSCVFATGCDECDGAGGVTDNPEVGDACDDGDATTENDVIIADCSCAGTAIPIGCTDMTACNFDMNAGIDDGSCIYATGCDECDGAGGVTDNPEVGDACDDGDATTENDVIIADCSCAGTAIPVGCTDMTACNFDMNAGIDDGSCIYATGCDVCDGAGGITDNPEVGDACDDGDATTENDVIIADCSCAGTAIPVGCTDMMACNFDPNAGIDDNSCVYATGCDECDGAGGVTDNPEVGDACDDGDANTENDIVLASCNCAGTPIVFGCTDPNACNYNMNATQDDGTCESLSCADCAGVPNGTATPGTPCDDGDPNTTGEVYQTDCTCATDPVPLPPFNDGVCDPATSIPEPAWPTQTTVCTDGSDALTLPALNGSLPDNEFIVEINGSLAAINATGDISGITLNANDEICYYGFTYDLAEINNILTTANGLCPVIDCDATFNIPGLTQAIADLVAGANDGNPGLNNLQEALDFAGSLDPTTTIGSAQDAAITLDAVNEQIGGLLGNICYASTDAFCVTAEECATCPVINDVIAPIGQCASVDYLACFLFDSVVDANTSVTINGNTVDGSAGTTEICVTFPVSVADQCVSETLPIVASAQCDGVAYDLSGFYISDLEIFSITGCGGTATCMDMTACNFDMTGDCDDNSLCDYTSCLDCEGVANGPAQPGTACTDANGNASTYDANCNCPDVTVIVPVIDPYLSDPCDCANPDNVTVNGVLYLFETVVIVGEAGQTWDLDPTTTFGVLDANGYPLSSVSFTESPAGTYTATFFHEEGVGYSANFTEGVNILPASNLCDGCTVDPCLLTVTPDYANAVCTDLDGDGTTDGPTIPLIVENAVGPAVWIDQDGNTTYDAGVDLDILTTAIVFPTTDFTVTILDEGNPDCALTVIVEGSQFDCTGVADGDTPNNTSCDIAASADVASATCVSYTEAQVPITVSGASGSVSFSGATVTGTGDAADPYLASVETGAGCGQITVTVTDNGSIIPPQGGGLTVTSPASVAGAFTTFGTNVVADFGIDFNTVTTPVAGTLALVNDGTPDETNFCEPTAPALPDPSVCANINGNIAVINRGACAFTNKIENAQACGAIAVIICNNDSTYPDDIINMIGTPQNPITIPTISLSFNSCVDLLVELSAGNTVEGSLVAPTPLAACETTITIDACAIDCGTPQIDGCTDMMACNFDPDATNDDGSCILPGDSCDDNDPNTINDVVQADCSCAGTPGTADCPTLYTASASTNEACSGDDLIILAQLAPSNATNAILSVESGTGAVLIANLTGPDAAGNFSGTIPLSNDSCGPETQTFVLNVECTDDNSLVATQTFDVTVYPSSIDQFISVSSDDCSASVSVDPACNGLISINGPSSFTANPGDSGSWDFCYEYFSSSAGACFDTEDCITVNYDCPDLPPSCDFDAGTFSNAVTFVCAGEFVNSPAVGADVSGGATLVYVLHDGTLPGGNIYGSSASGIFTNDGTYPTNVDLCISSVAGYPNAGGIPDFNDPCTDISDNCAPVVMLDPVVIETTEVCNEVSGGYDVTFSITGGGPGYAPGVHTYNVTGDYNNPNAMAGVTYTINSLADGTIYMINVEEDGKGCQASFTSEPVQCDKLPVELISYTGEVIAEGNLLKWTTASEIDNDYFTLERSTNGVNYEFLTTVEGNGTTSAINNYEFTDKNAPSGISYYKLLQTDFDGTTVVAGIVTLTRGETTFTIMNVYPVPVDDQLNVNYSSSTDAEVTIKVIDALGRTVAQQNRNASAGLNTTEIDMTNISAGIYFVQIQSGDFIQTQKFVKE